MRIDSDGCEQENWDRERRLERDAYREPRRFIGGLTARQREVRARLADICSVGGEVQPPVKTGGGR